ncbi:MAG: hypothetical protein ACLP59_01845 [Bryobacteraceae bacterium]
MTQYESNGTKNDYSQLGACYKFAMRTLLVAFLLVAVLPAYGSIIMWTGEVSVGAPPSAVAPDTSNSTIFGFAEQQGVVLASNVAVAFTSPGTWICCGSFPGGTIDMGTTVNSYLLYAAPTSDLQGTFTDFTGSITFSPGEKVIGVVVGYKNLAATAAMLGAPGTSYPNSSYKLGGLENDDEVIIGNNSQAVYVNFHVAEGGIDMIRILTETPEPADFLLLGSGLVALALFGRRLQHKRASRQL